MSTISNLDTLLVDTIQNKANDGPPTIAGFAGYPLPIAVDDVADGDTIAAAIVAALGLTMTADGWTMDAYFLSPDKDDRGYILYHTSGGAWVVDGLDWNATSPSGSGTIYLYNFSISYDE